MCLIVCFNQMIKCNFTRLMEKNSTTEEKIKQAARKVFTQKGYAATRTRDIAEESGFNLALINYYFRSKEKLFDIIMTEEISGFAEKVVAIVNTATTGFYEKVEQIADTYISFLIDHPGVPLFIINAMNDDPKKFFSKMGFNPKTEPPIVLMQLLEILIQEKRNVHPMNIMMNIMGMIVFPFLATPIAQRIGNMSKSELMFVLEHRKKMIPVWTKAIIEAS